MIYLFSFKKLENPTLLSKERNIYLKNIDDTFELNFFVNSFFKYQTNNIWIIPSYFKDNNALLSIIKIECWINTENYIKNKLFSTKYWEDNSIEKKQIQETHNIFNVVLFSLWLLENNTDILDNNIYLENLDSNKYSKLENKINVNWLNNNLNPYLDFSIIEKDLIEMFLFFDLNYKNYPLENFIYIWELLNLYNSTTSKYFKFSQLTSIIEFLLIWWDDIKQQFKLKWWIVIERLNKLSNVIYKKTFRSILWNTKDIIDELSCIYDIRSCIVHWSLKEINSKIWNYRKKYNKEIQGLINFDFYFRKLQDITSAILYLYIQEPEYINFLKNN